MIDTKALRQKILDMAIKGKLVPQNPDDEPASVLLERIRAEKQQLIKEGKIKKDKNDSIIYKGDDNRYYEKVGSEVKDITDEIDFDLPSGWEFIKLSQIGTLCNGYTPKDEDLDTIGTVPYFKISDMNKEGNEAYLNYTDLFAINPKRIFPKNSIVFPKNGGAVFTNKKRILAQDSVVDLNTAVFIPSSLLDMRYAYTIFSTIDFNDFYKGTALPTIKSNFVNTKFYGLPPIAEQKRIIDRIEELFNQITAIEQNQADIEKLYDEFRKRTLTLAIQGKLVPQNPNDEPASVLLERIRAEKKAKLGKKYVDSYIYKGDDNCYYEKVGETVTNISDEMPFDLPENWEWCRLQMICSYIHRGKSPTYGTEKILPIIAQKCNQWSGIQTQKCLFADRATIKKYTEEQYLCVGDIIINSTGTGTVGRTGYVDDTLFKEYPKFVADSHVTVVRPLEHIDSKYIYLFLKSPVIQTDIEAKCSGSTNQIELATKTIQSYLIPLPPVAEQYRITSMFFALEARLKDEV